MKIIKQTHDKTYGCYSEPRNTISVDIIKLQIKVEATACAIQDYSNVTGIQIRKYIFWTYCEIASPFSVNQDVKYF